MADTQTQEGTALATQQAAQAPAAIAKAPVRMGLAPTTLDEAWRMSQFMANSEMVPKQYQQKPADVLVAIQYGMELGFAPMQALQSIAVINGRPSVWGDGILALIMSSQHYRDHDEYFEVAVQDGQQWVMQRRDGLTAEDLKSDNTKAVCSFWRHGKQTPVTRRFSVAQAKKAALLGKQGPWQNYPDRMMSMRARGFAARDAFPDVLRGIKTPEEAMDTALDELPIVEPERVQPRRASETRVIDQPAAAAPTASTVTDNTAAPAAETQPRETRGLSILKTGFVRPKQGEPYYQIQTKAVTGNEFSFVTRDEGLYKEAESFEGTDHLVAIKWRGVTQIDKHVSEALSLAIDETTSTAGAKSESGLFE